MADTPNSPRHSPFAFWRWPKWTWFLIVPLLFTAYPLSFGPACWIAAQTKLPRSCQIVSQLYRPVALSVLTGPQWYQSLMRATIRTGLPKDVELLDDRQGIYLNFEKQGFTYTILGF